MEDLKKGILKNRVGWGFRGGGAWIVKWLDLKDVS